MPAYSSLRTFVNALRTGQTHITKTFVKALADPNFDPVQIDDDSKVVPLSPWIEARLLHLGLKQAEIDHINNEWPVPKKKLARKWAYLALTANPKRGVDFSWELSPEDEPDNKKHDPGAPDPILIRFLSPRKGVKLSRSRASQIHVDR